MARSSSYLPQEIIPASSWKQVVLNVVVPLLLLLGVMLVPYPSSLRYRSLDGDAEKFRWVYSRLHEQTAPLDLALIGTSRTMGAVNDSLVQAELERRYGLEIATANLGVSWQGRDMAYLMTRTVLENKACRFLVIEVQESLARTGHPLFGTLAESVDIVEAPLLINRGYFTNLWRLPRREAENVTRYLGLQLGLPVTVEDLGTLADRAHFPFSHDAVPGPAEMARMNAEFEARKQWRVLPEQLDGLEFGMPRSYLRKCVALARESGVDLVFLYLPYFGYQGSPQDEQFFREHGTLLMPPTAILEEAENWYDATHLNTAGNRLISAWLVDELARLAAAGG